MPRHNSTNPPEIAAAFREVQRFFPDVCLVVYLPDARWIFMDADGDSPSFAKSGISQEVLDNAADSVSHCPALFFDETAYRDTWGTDA